MDKFLSRRMVGVLFSAIVVFTLNGLAILIFDVGMKLSGFECLMVGFLVAWANDK